MPIPLIGLEQTHERYRGRSEARDEPIKLRVKERYRADIAQIHRRPRLTIDLSDRGRGAINVPLKCRELGSNRDNPREQIYVRDPESGISREHASA